MKGALNGLLALVSLLVAGLCLYQYRGTANALYLVGIFLFVILALILGGMFLSNKINRTEDIHITE